MERMETRLEMLIQIIAGEMSLELRSNSFSKDFGKEWKIRSRLKIIKVIGICTGLLKCRNDSSCFER